MARLKGGRVVDIEFYQNDNLPLPLLKKAEKQGVNLRKGVVAVKTILSSPPSYEFISIGNKPSQFKKFLAEIVEQDGEDLDEVVKRAFAE